MNNRNSISVDECGRETDGPAKVTVGAIAKPSPIDGKYQQKNWNLNRIYQWKYLEQNDHHHVTCIIINRQSMISIRNNMTHGQDGSEIVEEESIIIMSTCHKETEAIDVERINTYSASALAAASVISLGTESMYTERSRINIRLMVAADGSGMQSPL